MPEMSDIRTHRRTLQTFTAPLEKPLLIWLAGQMPAWVNPDILTGIGIFGALVVFAGYWLSSQDNAFLWLASLGFVINWFGDSLDGTLARVRHIERPQYGFFIDHVVDAYVETLVFVGLGLSPLVRLDLALLALVGYLLISVIAYIYTCVIGEFKLSYVGLGPTEARLIAIGANTLIFFLGNPKFQMFEYKLTAFDWILVGILFLETAIIVVYSIKQGRYLANLDRGSSK